MLHSTVEFSWQEEMAAFLHRRHSCISVESSIDQGNEGGKLHANCVKSLATTHLLEPSLHYEPAANAMLLSSHFP